MEKLRNGQVKIIPISSLPNSSLPIVKGAYFGWRMFVESSKPQFTWTEIYTHPKAPPRWIVYNPTVISADSRTATTKRTQYLSGGKATISAFWGFVGEEHPGEYEFKIQINDETVCTFSVMVRR